MALDLDEQTRVTALAAAVQSHLDKTAPSLAPPPQQPLFIRNADGSVNTRAGVQVRGPLELTLPKVK